MNIFHSIAYIKQIISWRQELSKREIMLNFLYAQIWINENHLI